MKASDRAARARFRLKRRAAGLKFLIPLAVLSMVEMQRRLEGHE